jgi:hypothetical protein
VCASRRTCGDGAICALSSAFSFACEPAVFPSFSVVDGTPTGPPIKPQKEGLLRRLPWVPRAGSNPNNKDSPDASPWRARRPYPGSERHRVDPLGRAVAYEEPSRASRLTAMPSARSTGSGWPGSEV